jgi:two-component system, sensor histidine kinase and response regulator
MDANTQQSPGAVDEGLNQNALDELRALDPDGSGGILNQIIQSYLDDAPTQIAQIRASFAAGDIEGMMRAAHSMKSTSQTLGAVRVGELAREIEAIGRAQTIEGCQAILAELERQFAHAAKMLQACMAAPAA